MSFHIRGKFHSRRHALAVQRKVKDAYWAKKLAEKNDRIHRLQELLGTGEPVDLVKELGVSKGTILRYINDLQLAPGLVLNELTDGRFQLRQAA